MRVYAVHYHQYAMSLRTLDCVGTSYLSAHKGLLSLDTIQVGRNTLHIIVYKFVFIFNPKHLYTYNKDIHKTPLNFPMRLCY